jgi:hypothetical protein
MTLALSSFTGVGVGAASPALLLATRALVVTTEIICIMRMAHPLRLFHALESGAVPRGSRGHASI